MVPPLRHPLARLALGFLVSFTMLRAEPGHMFPPVKPADAARIEAALPKEKFSPARPRRLLVFTRTEGFVHSSIPVGLLAMQRLGQQTGAFTVVASEDMAMFEPDKLAGFDAILFLSTTKLAFANPAHRQALLDFVRGGKGLAGLHAASDNFYTWPEGQSLLGGVFHSHPWTSGDVCAVKLDEPGHVLNLPFGGSGFWVREEIYQIVGPYNRGHQRVLLSMDMSKPRNARPAGKLKRTDNDFPISWIRTEGRGRVFYTSLGHREDIYFVPAILRHMLEGIRYALGDLPADAVPSAQAPAVAPALAPDDATPVQDRLPGAAPMASSAPAAAAKTPDAPSLAQLSPPERAAREPALRAALLDPAATPNSKFAALAELTLAATADTVPALAATAASDEPGLAERAAVVLSQLRVPAAEAALLTLTETRAPGTRSPVLHALRAYPTDPVLHCLSVLAKDPNPIDALAARAALATFGTRPALDVLRALPSGPDTTRFALAAADALLARDPQAAPEVVKAASAALQPAASPSDRVEAVRLLAKALPPADSARLLDFATDAQPRVRQAAVVAVVTARQPGPLASLAKTWPTLPPDTQIAALSAVGDATGLPLARLGLTATDPTVVPVAIAAIARTADTEAVLALIPRLVETGPVAAATYAALATSQSKDLSPGLTAAAAQPKTPPALRAALVSLLDDRQAIAAQPLIAELCASPDDAVRAAAFKALGDLAQSVSLATIIAQAGNAKKSADKRAFRKALYVAAGADADRAKAAALLDQAIADPSATDRATLVGALTLVTGPEATAVLDRLLAAPAAADRKDVIRALSAARTEGSLALLKKTAGNAPADDERILALRGCIETLPTLDELAGREKINRFRELWPLAGRAEEKDAILAAVRQFKSKEADAFLKEFAAPKPAEGTKA